ncbi:hypothetical protein ASD44_06525 [Mesorhizobium sp. Root554]|uniref:hypothetical protein n=1 Tax=unclassified Mesorhizobium TaxID=325217 RepID=UPI0006F231F3|nr:MULTISPECIES: hypothetical protein [unclassified Mesorhizobium]KQZ13764.1 hypothetical protein ASD27_06530 [Mesorhizobium sp. Root1471]KQZ36275.1 hypothetical protein ASD44_06525 [Mesorhizobium sp. Root554]
MFLKVRRLFVPALAAAMLAMAAGVAQTQDADGLGNLHLPDISGYAPPRSNGSLATGQAGEITLSAQLMDKGADITRGIVWRVFRPEPGADGKLPLVASAHGGTSVLQLEPGSYLVHASYGRAGATKRITVSREPKRESLVLDAGGLELDAVSSGGVRIPPAKLRFSIYDGHAEADGDRPLIIPDVQPNTVVRLNAGVYHVVSTYGAVNAVIRSDIRVEAGKLTEATVEHRAAEVTMKLVRETGGEAIADTSWSVLNESGDPIKEMVGAFAPMVLAEGDYTVIAKNRDRIYQKDIKVEAGKNAEVEVIASDATAIDPEEGAD